MSDVGAAMPLAAVLLAAGLVDASAQEQRNGLPSDDVNHCGVVASGATMPLVGDTVVRRSPADAAVQAWSPVPTTATSDTKS